MPAYTELHAHSHFSLLDGASSPADLVAQAVRLGMEALALTDHDAAYGAPAFVKAARAADIRPILGVELTLHDQSHLTLLAADSTGWANLCALITAARHNVEKGEARLPRGGLEGHTEGLVALSGCRQGAVASALLRQDRPGALKAAQALLRLFGQDRLWIELQHHLLPGDEVLMSESVALAQHLGVGYLATNNVHYADPATHTLQDVLVAIRHHTTLDECRHLRPNSEFYLKPGDELAPLFARYPQALSNSGEVAALCDFQLEYGLQELPSFPAPDGLSAEIYLARLCQAQAAILDLPSNGLAQLAYELRIIEESHLANYFLIVWDLVRFARENGILCQGRGSAANSLVAYLLGISPINPLAHDLVFERFLSTERQVAPDIDIDFDAVRREEVIQYVYQRYGTDHAAMACTFVTFRARSAIRDVGKAFGLPPEVLDQVAGTLDTWLARDVGKSSALHEAVGEGATNPTWTQIIDLSHRLEGVPRHLGIHNGGMVITGAPLSHRLPTEPATMEDRVVVQWDKEALEEVGLVKIDLLGLRMLSAIAEAEALIGQSAPESDFTDPAIYDLICAADTVGVFQVESRAQAQVLPRLQPRCFADLIVCISLIRPGPIQGDMVHPYLCRRAGQEPVGYPHPLLEPALRETLGVILFQEQVLKVARDLAGFTAGEGELLRRALSSKDPGPAVERFRQAFISGAADNGVDAETAESVFNRLRAFGGYSFPKSHAAAFAVLVYRSAWLKRYHPAAFFVALLNHQPMGFWTPAVLINDARRHGLTVTGVEINRSDWRCTVEGDGLRLGFNYVRELTEVQAAAICTARPFTDLGDLVYRTGLPRRLVEHLIQAGALDACGWGGRRELLWRLGLLREPDALGLATPAPSIRLPTLTAAESAGMEVAMTGLSTGPHPMVVYRAALRREGVRSSADLAACPTGTQVRVAGLMVVHQAPPTAKGFHFLTLEDECGFINVIVRPLVYIRYRQIIRAHPVLMVEGEVQWEGEVVNVIATCTTSL